MNKSEEQEIKKEFQLERVILFSDAVFAIIITIMVLDIRLPEDIRHADAAHVRKAFLELIPKALAYGLSFFLVSKFWLGHLKMFSHLKDYDAKLLTYNLLYLFSVSLFPFAVTLISGNVNPSGPAYGWGIYTYAAVIFITTLFQTLLSRYLVRNSERLCFEPKMVPVVLKYRALQYNFITIPVAAVVVFGISWFNFPAYYSMVAVGLYGAFMGRLFKRFYPEARNGLVVMRLFSSIKKRRRRLPRALKKSN
ncbi:MAG: TMEM175 family protein [Bacteroidota bacterium]